MPEPPVAVAVGGLCHFTEGSIAYAGRWLHEGGHPAHTHSFVEIAITMGGAGTHGSMPGRHPLRAGDVVLLRPGVWHEYQDCRGLDMYNCCFSAELLRREFAWTREDPLLGPLLWTGPYAMDRRGMLPGHLDRSALEECRVPLDALSRVCFEPVARYRADIVGHLSVFLGVLARALAGGTVVSGGRPPGPTHPAVPAAMRLLEDRMAHAWTLSDLADELHLTPSYLVRLFKSAVGLPPMAYLARQRAETAAALLIHTDLPIARIGESVGWTDPNYFARRFKAHFGLSATTYRARFAHHSAARWPRRVPAPAVRSGHGLARS